MSVKEKAVEQNGEFNPDTLETVKHVAMDTFKFEAGTTRYFKFESKIENRETNEKDEKGKLKTINIAEVSDMQKKGDESRGELVIASVLGIDLEKCYADGSYVGRIFKIFKSAEKKGAIASKMYYVYTITEVRIPASK